jgi:hypothetical protein
MIEIEWGEKWPVVWLFQAESTPNLLNRMGRQMAWSTLPEPFLATPLRASFFSFTVGETPKIWSTPVW